MKYQNDKIFPYVWEVSAATGENVNDLFEKITLWSIYLAYYYFY